MVRRECPKGHARILARTRNRDKPQDVPILTRTKLPRLRDSRLMRKAPVTDTMPQESW